LTRQLTSSSQRDLILGKPEDRSAEDISAVFTIACHVGNNQIRDFTVRRILELDLTVTALRKPLAEAASRLQASATSCGKLVSALA
jgi:hypothetical protein